MKKPGSGKKTILGVTGSFGTGKSTVAAMLGKFGAKVIDADKIAHELTRFGRPAYNSIVRIFGKGVLKSGKEIDRAALRRIAFDDKTLLDKLNRCLHPAVIKEIKKRIRAARSKVIVLDAPLLLEAGLGRIVDKLIVVKCSRKKQKERVRGRKRLSDRSINAIIKSQMPLGKKVSVADFIIDNNGTLRKTREQVIQIIPGHIGLAGIPLWVRRKVWKN